MQSVGVRVRAWVGGQEGGRKGGRGREGEGGRGGRESERVTGREQEQEREMKELSTEQLLNLYLSDSRSPPRTAGGASLLWLSVLNIQGSRERMCRAEQRSIS